MRVLLRAWRWLRRRWWWVLAIISCGVALHLLVAPQHLPWRSLNLNHPVGFATGTKLAALNLTPRSWCAAVLQDVNHLVVKPVKPTRNEKGCGWSHAYELMSSRTVGLRGNGTYPMNCPLIAASHLWLNEVLNAAQQHLNQPVTHVHHAGTYSCRRKYGRSTGSLSEHAFANAWDITGFELADGSVVSVKKHWQGFGARSRFLHAVRDAGCTLYNVVLSPDYNAAHHDHLHLDMGPYMSCR